MPRNIDRDTGNFQSGVDGVLNFLLPRGSGPNRVLRFELEAVTETGEVVRYGVNYVRPHSYTQVYGYLTGENSVVVKGSDSNWGTFKSIPLSGVVIDDINQIRKDPGSGMRGLLAGLCNRDELIGRAQTTDYDGHVVTIPGELVCYANHDSCYRDYGTKTLQRVETVGREPIHIHRVKTWRVLSITIDGPKGDSFEREVTNDQWVNPNPKTLTGIYALFTAVGALAHIVSKHRSLRLTLDWELFEVKDDGGIIDRTPRDEDYNNPLNAITRLNFNEEGQVVSINGADIEPEFLSRDFFLTHWDLPESEFTYGIGRVATWFGDGTYLDQEIKAI